MRNRRLNPYLFVLLTMAIAAIIIIGIGTMPHSPQVTYIAPAYGGIPNIVSVDINNTEQHQQLTDTKNTIYDMDTSPDGRYVAFTERDNSTGRLDIWLRDMNNGEIQALTRCNEQEADCSNPVFRPDGNYIAYMRTDDNISSTAEEHKRARIWLADLTTTPISNYPLLASESIGGYSPAWSGDGSHIAFFSPSDDQPGIMIINFDATDDDGALQLIPSRFGAMGAISPDGKRVIFPELIQRGKNGSASYLKMADMERQLYGSLTDPEDPINDVYAAWHPDGKQIVLARQYLDDRWTRGHQVYLMDMETRELTELIVDQRYNTSFFQWNADGSKLLMQRFPVSDDNGRPLSDAQPEIWVYDMTDNSLTMLAENAFFPRWLGN